VARKKTDAAAPDVVADRPKARRKSGATSAVADVTEPVVAPESAGESVIGVSVAQVIIFSLGDQAYALPLDSVQEIQQIVEFTALPDEAPALVGLLDLRGEVVPAIDLRLLVGLERVQYRLETPMIVCHASGRLVSLIVDAVEDVVDLPPDCIQPPSQLYALADRMLGVCRLERGLVLVLDPARLVPDSALASVVEGASS
jgi:purine-binding chemotaxis protein CheW